jgi:hypothetical protein
MAAVGAGTTLRLFPLGLWSTDGIQRSPHSDAKNCQTINSTTITNMT